MLNLINYKNSRLFFRIIVKGVKENNENKQDTRKCKRSARLYENA